MLFSLLDRWLAPKIDPKDFPECLECGACCAYFKVYFSEKNNPNYKKLGENIHFVSKDKIFMKGREVFAKGGSCIALSGTIDKQVSCKVYENRSDVCRNFDRVLPNGKINPRCIQARKGLGLSIKKS